MAKTKRPSWSLWKRKSNGELIFDLQREIRPTFEWNTRSYIPSPYTEELFEELNPAEFTIVTTLKLKTISAASAGCHFYFEDIKNGGSYIMLPSEMEDLLKTATLYKGAVTGRWRFVKKGSSIGICLVEELATDEEEEDEVL